ncbi:DUF296 domain-containing protein [Candidatus Fermentibacterales bacterium]|nr:DUF296 domain-containing protein [Candidatus Fermentibacterales bacterium]
MKQLLQSEKMVLLRFDRGDELISDLSRWFAQSGLSGAVIASGIGMVEDFEIGAYRPEGYEKSRMEGPAELLALSGNISTKQGDPFPHVHVVLGRHDRSTMGGHLFRAGIAVTVEMCLLPASDTRLLRRENPGIPGFWQLDSETG